MPSLVTHYVFGKDVLDRIDNKYVDTNQYLLFNQSHDFLYRTKKKEYINLAKLGHHYKTKVFIINIVKFIMDNNLEKDKGAISFLYGIINHFVLDSICHPLIFYYGGSYHKDDKSTKKYQGMHGYIEKNIDMYIYEKYYKKSYKSAVLDKEFLPIADITSLDVINNAYLSTYGKDNVAYEYKKCVNKLRRFNRFIVRDKIGIKYLLYNLIDKICFNNFGTLSCYSTCIKKNYDYLNKNHEVWYHPVTNEKHTESFQDLYDLSIKKSLDIIKAVNKVLYDNYDISYLDNYIYNIDYANGLPIKKGTVMKYFKY